MTITVTPEQLVLMWTQEEIRILCERPHDLEDHPDLAMRIRGAFGRMLALAGPPITHRFDPFDRPAPFPALFGTSTEDAVRPFAIAADVLADFVQVDLRLFGHAAFWAEQCCEALIAALEGGVAIRAAGRHKQRLHPVDCRMRRTCAALPPGSVRSAHIALLTPVAVRSGSGLLASPAAVLYATVTRVRRLCTWLGVELSADFGALQACSQAAAVVHERLLFYRSVRWSQRQPGRDIPVVGLLGEFAVEGRLSPLAPFLSLAEQVHIGSHAALGMGRVRISMYP